MPGATRSVLAISSVCCGLALVVVGGLRFSHDRGTALGLLGGALLLVVLGIVLTGTGSQDEEPPARRPQE